MICGLTAMASGAFADSQPALVVTPEKVSAEVQPGQKAKGKVTISNNGDIPINLKVSAKDVKLLDETGRVEFYIKDTDSVSQWIVPEFLKVNLAPHSSKDINYLITVPKNATNKGYDGAIVFSKTDGDAVGPENDFGQLIFINVRAADNINPSPKILDFSIPRIQTRLPSDLSLRVKNASANNIIIDGTISIKNWKGVDIETTEVKNLIVFPKATNLFKWSWKKSHELFGLYRAEISLNIPNGKPVREDSWFLSLPFPPLEKLMDFFKKI